MIWKSKRTRDRNRGGSAQAVTRRRRGLERLEARRLMAADPIHVGVVYLETDYLESDQDVGSDSQGDRFILSFTGGAPETELRELRLRTDKDGDGISVGDPIYDTAAGGRGKNGFHDFQLVSTHSGDGRAIQAAAEVADGGQELVLRLKNFQAGDRLEFTLDVDEVLRNASDLATFNDRLDVITSGQEFQDSILEASFRAPHHQDGSADAVFVNDYGAPAQTHGLDLPPDQGDDVDSRPNRSAAAVASTVQVPKPVSISGHVWLDNDLDRTRQSTEPGLEGVELSLLRYDAAGDTFVDTGHRSITDASGRYEFDQTLGLAPGRYQVVQTQPEGLLSVTAVPGIVAGTESGRAASPNVLTDIEIPLGGQAAANFDFAEAQPAELSGHVYRDDNDNGRRDAGEPGLGDIRVRLVPVDTLAAQPPLVVATADDGSYSFSGVAPGTYHVVELDQPAGLDDGRDSPGTVDGQTVGTADAAGDRIRDVVLHGNSTGSDFDFGELPLGSLTGVVFVPPAGESCHGRDHSDRVPLSGVEVELQTSEGIAVRRTTTGADGSYRFDSLSKGTYRIREFTPEGLVDGDSHVGWLSGVQVGESVDGGLLQNIVLGAGGQGIEYDFCEAAPATLSGYVYHDQSDDGRKDTGESGIAGVSLTLVDADGSRIATTQSDSNGYYEFGGIQPGEYSILEAQPAGYLDGTDSRGSIGGRRSGNIGSDGDSLTAIALRQGEHGRDFNFGELLPASLAGRVHVDPNDNGQFDSGEPPLEGVTVRLVDAAGDEVGRTTTDATGQYRFENIASGVYSVIEETPAGFFEGRARAGSAGGAIHGPNRIEQIRLGSGEAAADYDFSERPPASISGVVFVDTDQNDALDSSEARLANVSVELYDDAGQRVATTRTDAEGVYHFGDLAAGNYTVREIQPGSWFHGGQTAGSHGGDDAMADAISGVPVSWGDRLTQYNFFEYAASTLRGVVFADSNGNKALEETETRLENVVVELHDDSGRRVATARTNANGIYRFSHLAAGSYTVREIQPEGWLQGGQTSGSHGGDDATADAISEIPVGWGEQLTEYNFFEIAPSSLRGTVFVDADGDCHHDSGETPLPGVTVDLFDGRGNLAASTTTDADGNYRFEGLAPGRYEIVEHQPSGYFQGCQMIGSGGGEVLGEDHMAVTLTSGTDLVDYHFSELAPSSISGRAWSETDLDHDFGPGEAPASGARVDLLNAAGERVDSAETDASGRYRFAELPPGVYSIRQHQPSGLFHGGQVIGSAGGQVGGDDWLIGIALTGGTDADGYDFPEVPPATISGHVFQDGEPLTLGEAPAPEDLRRYRDGQRTPDDRPLAGVTLELRETDGTPIGSDHALPGTYGAGPIRVTTDADGFYRFAGLPAGTYHLYQLQPNDLLDGLDTAGTTGGVALNPADAVTDSADQDLIRRLRADEQTDPGHDAILNIALAAGGASENNNFSEIVVEPVVPPTVAPPTTETTAVTAPVETFDRPIRAVAFSSSVSYRQPIVAVGEWAVSWHLSVINAGFPRGGAAQSLTVESISGKRISDWNEEELNSGRWTFMAEANPAPQFTEAFALGADDATALTGDFNGDGSDEPALFIGGQWFVDLNGNGRWDAGDLWVRLGTEMDRPVVGDWDGDGKDDVGIFGRQWHRDPERIKYDPGLPDPANQRRREMDRGMRAAETDQDAGDPRRWLRRGSDGPLRADAVDHVFQYGEQVDTPLAGDWNGDGIDQIAVFRSGEWLLDNNGDGRWTTGQDQKLNFGEPGDTPVVGDFNGDGIDEVGVIRGDTWIIDTDGDRRITSNDLRIALPPTGRNSQPVVGDFDGDGKDEPGYYDEAG